MNPNEQTQKTAIKAAAIKTLKLLQERRGEKSSQGFQANAQGRIRTTKRCHNSSTFNNSSIVKAYTQVTSTNSVYTQMCNMGTPTKSQ